MMWQPEHLNRWKLGIQTGAFILASAIDYQDLQPLADLGFLQSFQGAPQFSSLIEGD